ncbi:MAG: signal peptidase I [Anaerolineae bacterium]|nr:signal peptidase I [Anaerolineae bacterium]
MTLSADNIATITTLSSIFGLALYVVFAAGLWKTLAKAGEPGWMAIVPILNWYFMVKLSGRPGWWMLMFFVPILNLVIWLMVALDTAYAFGKTTLTGILLFFLPWVMYLVLGFSDATYRKPSGN